MEIIDCLSSSSDDSEDSDSEMFFNVFFPSSCPQEKKVRVANFVEDVIDRYNDKQVKTFHTKVN